MKCPKSVKVKYSASSSGSVGHLGAARVPLRELGDDAGRGRADVVDVQFGLRQSGDEVAQIAHGNRV